MNIGTHHARPNTEQEVSGFASQLKDAGMSDKRAEVYARSMYGKQNKEIVEELDIPKSAVSQHISAAEEQIEQAEQLISLTSSPDYVSVLSEEVVDTIYQSDATEGYLGFSIHNPEKNTLYAFGSGAVIEGYYMTEADEFLLIHHQRRGHRGVKTGILVEPDDLERFLIDWVFSDNFDPIVNERNSDEWFLTGKNTEPEWIENVLNEHGIETVEATTDDRFLSPIKDDGVYCSSGSKSGQYHTGFKIAYQPTDKEIAQLLVDGEITDDEAEKAARKPPEELREIAAAEPNQ